MNIAKRSILFGILLAGVGCQTSTPIPDIHSSQVNLIAFDFTIDDFHGAEGYGIVYRVTPDLITLTLNSDWGVPPRELWRVNLSEPQRRILNEYLTHIPLAKLESRYVDPRVYDGKQMTFTISVNGSTPKKIFVGNVSQPDLDGLASQVDAIVPERYRIKVGASVKVN